MSALNGNLRDFGIAEVFQLIGQQQKTGLLEIQDGKRRITLAFDDGAVVWATPTGRTEHAELGDRLVRCGLLTRERLAELFDECQSSARSLPSLAIATGAVAESDLEEIRELLTRDTIFEVLRWTQGSFRFVAQPVANDRPDDVRLGAEQILMDGLRMVDEWQTFAAQVPSGDAVFERTGSFESHRPQGDARQRSSDSERIFELIDGRVSCQRVIDLSRLGIFDATRILAELRTSGVISLVDPNRVRKFSAATSHAGRNGSRLTAALATAVPMLLLIASVGWLFQQKAPGRHPLAVEQNPLETARAEFQKRRLRYAVEADRFLNGRWPESLGEATNSGLIAPESLARVPVDAYYYARRADELLLLAPER